MGKFKSEKGKVIISSQESVNVRVTIHEKTDPALVRMLHEAVIRAKEQTHEPYSTEK